MDKQPKLKKYHSSRWVCHYDGYFEAFTVKRPPDKFIIMCPKCKKPAQRLWREECDGYTFSIPIPSYSRPRLEKIPERETTYSPKAKFVGRRGKAW